jgi:hypothetical protein
METTPQPSPNLSNVFSVDALLKSAPIPGVDYIRVYEADYTDSDFSNYSDDCDCKEVIEEANEEKFLVQEDVIQKAVSQESDVTQEGLSQESAVTQEGLSHGDDVTQEADTQGVVFNQEAVNALPKPYQPMNPLPTPSQPAVFSKPYIFEAYSEISAPPNLPKLQTSLCPDPTLLKTASASARTPLTPSMFFPPSCTTALKSSSTDSPLNAVDDFTSKSIFAKTWEDVLPSGSGLSTAEGRAFENCYPLHSVDLKGDLKGKYEGLYVHEVEDFFAI